MDLSVCRSGFRGPGILIKRSTIVDLSVYAAWLRGPDISQNIQQIFLKYPKSDYRAFAFNRCHYAADNRTACDIQNFGPFWFVKIQGGQCPPGPPDINIPVHRPLYACARSAKWSSTFLKITPPGLNQPTPMNVMAIR